jgi:hypothetical protein
MTSLRIRVFVKFFKRGYVFTPFRTDAISAMIQPAGWCNAFGEW